jgi:16S rRNA (guanine966-N2)-methyltransferase
MLRVIGGSAKGRRLRLPKGAGTRPTSDKVREALFNILASLGGVEGARVLDLYAGSGALGIEALSRGAAWADFVERDRAACQVVRHNLTVTDLASRAGVHCLPAERAPGRLTGPYGLVLADPPYTDPQAAAVLDHVARSDLVEPGTVLVYEHAARSAPPEALGPFGRVLTRRHGDTALSIYRQVGGV